MTELEKTMLEVYGRLANQAESLRRAQRDYMKKRGDDALGKKVEEAATKLDEILEVVEKLRRKEDYE